MNRRKSEQGKERRERVEEEEYGQTEELGGRRDIVFTLMDVYFESLFGLGLGL